MATMKYIGTLDTGKSNLKSRAEFKLDKGGVAFLEFDQGDLNQGKLGLKGFMAHDKLKTSLWYQPSTNKGNLEMVADVGYDTTVTVAPNYPLPQDVMQVPVKFITKKTVKAVDVMVTARPLAKSGSLSLRKTLPDSKHFSKGVVQIDHPEDTISMSLWSNQFEFQNIKHDLKLTMLTPFGNSSVAAKNTLLYTGVITDELKIKAELCQPRAKGNLATLSAVYKIGDIEATASVDVTSNNQLANSNLILKTTLDI
jgi:hypothetical protein